METLHERLKNFIKYRYDSIKQFANEAGFKPSTINDYVNGYALPGAEALKKFAMTGLNINWLLTGQGLMIEQVIEETVLEYLFKPNDKFLKNLFVEELKDEDRIFEKGGARFQELFVREKLDLPSLVNDRCLIGYVSGDSMETFGLKNNDYIVIEKSDNSSLENSIVIIQFYDADTKVNRFYLRYYDSKGMLITDHALLGGLSPQDVSIVPVKITSVIRPFSRWLSGGG